MPFHFFNEKSFYEFYFLYQNLFCRIMRALKLALVYLNAQEKKKKETRNIIRDLHFAIFHFANEKINNRLNFTVCVHQPLAP